MNRIFRLVTALLAALLTSGCAGIQGPSPSTPLMLAEQGSFFVGGRNTRSETLSSSPIWSRNGTITREQMYVRYQVPVNANKVPVTLVQQLGRAPDYRFSLANERTFLAWIRTALAIAAGAVLLHQFGVRLGPPWLGKTMPAGLAVLAAWISISALRRWKSYELAMRLEQPLPVGIGLAAVAVTVALGALIVAAVVAWAP